MCIGEKCMTSHERWIIVSNRLPYQYDINTQSLTLSSGGLVTAITGMHSQATQLWVGAVLTPELEKWQQKRVVDSAAFSYEPVPVTVEDYDSYYNGFCNDVLWPLFHYQSERVQFRHQDWEMYQKVNRDFAEHIHRIAKPGDLIWIHDFQLCLVPQYLKELNPNLVIGWFLHIPFPSSELYLELPVREEILNGILSADLVGFQDYAYVHHFCSSVQRCFGIETSLFSIQYKERQVNLGVFPVSIDYHHFHKAAQKPEVTKLAAEYHGVGFLFLGVDRLDYTKGVDLKLRAFECFLKDYPEYHGKVSMVQVAIPTRQDVDEYVKLRLDIEHLVSEVNGQYATPSWTPILYLFHSVTFDELMSLYRAADGLVVTSKRDGMNLVALEYVAAQSLDNPGVVLISEFAGAHSLLSGAVSINPRDIEGTAKKMLTSMQLPVTERYSACQKMQAYLSQYTATDWGELFIEKLKQVAMQEQQRSITILHHPQDFLNNYIKQYPNEKILLLLDYDGTLVQICQRPEDAILSAQMKQALKEVSEKPCIEIVIISGRDQDFLTEQLSGLDVYIAAEHGALFFDREKWYNLAVSDQNEWYRSTQQIMEHYAQLVPESFIEHKKFCISWHYRKSPPEFARQQALKLYEELENGLSRLPARLINGKKVIEVCAMEANKGVFTHWFLERNPEFKYGIAIGDDRTDEDIFVELRNTSYATVRVGPGQTAAKYRLPTQASINLLVPGT